MTSPEQHTVDDGHGHDVPQEDPATEAAIVALALLLLLLLTAAPTLALLGAAGVAGTAAQTVGAIVRGRGGGTVSTRAVSRPDYRAQAIRLLQALGISRSTAVLVVSAYGRQPFVVPRGGMVSLEQARQAPTWRARYIVNAARRIDEAERAARENATRAGEDPDAAAAAARQRQLERERRYWQQHLDAERRRQDGAAWLDEAAAQWGPRLTWVAVLDKGTTPECRVAHGHWFDLDANRPRIGLPGTGPHDRCRCIPGPPGWASCPDGWSVNRALALPPALWPTHHHL